LLIYLVQIFSRATPELASRARHGALGAYSHLSLFTRVFTPRSDLFSIFTLIFTFVFPPSSVVKSLRGGGRLGVWGVVLVVCVCVCVGDVVLCLCVCDLLIFLLRVQIFSRATPDLASQHGTLLSAPIHTCPIHTCLHTFFRSFLSMHTCIHTCLHTSFRSFLGPRRSSPLEHGTGPWAPLPTCACLPLKSSGANASTSSHAATSPS